MISLDDKAFEVFGKIHAEEDLKQKTTSYLRAEAVSRMRRRRIYRLSACILSLSLFFFCGALLLRAYFTPVAYIDFDVNPSIELKVNRFGRVIAAHAYNDDGQEILGYWNVSHQSYKEAAKRLLLAMEEEGYFQADTLLSVTVQTGEADREGNMLKSLEEIIAQVGQAEKYNILAEVYAVTEEIKHCASEHQVSPAKYLAIEELIEVDPEADFESCKGQSVHELRERANGCGQGGGHHGWEEDRDTEEEGEINDQTNQPGYGNNPNSHGHHGGHNR